MKSLLAIIALATVSSNAFAFTCTLNDSNRTYLMPSISESEPYMKEYGLEDLTFSAYKNEDEKTYMVQITDESSLIVKTDLPYGDDFKLVYKNYFIQCMK